MNELGFDPRLELTRLRDFQRRTVDYVFRRLYLDQDATRRFLVADEVGLGKTLVARGVIARAIEYLRPMTPRIDIVYICSNATIARQNLNRLNLLGVPDTSLATRLTLLPTAIGQIEANTVNFVGFTPGTTFDLGRRGGLMDERVLLYHLLRRDLGLRDVGLLNLLQGSAGKDSWRRYVRSKPVYDAGLADEFRRSVAQDAVLMARLAEACERFRRARSKVRPADNELRYELIGHLRLHLARTCIKRLEPDLVILDEFQRFRHLLHGDDDAAWLAKQLFEHPGVRVLLLSATPYKMLTFDHEPEDHWHDFLETMRFLFGNNDQVIQALRAELGRYREALWQLPQVPARQVVEARDAVVRRLRAVMCRTERTSLSDTDDEMLVERVGCPPPEPLDLEHATLTARVARALDVGDTVEYWKSCPYFLNFARNGYKLGQKLEAPSGSPPDDLSSALRESRILLRRRSIAGYQRIDPANSRLRQLLADVLETGLWQLIWLPPSLPYYRLAAPFEGVGDVTKALVFSAWKAVPDAVSTLCSYEAERRMLLGDPEKPSYFQTTRKLRGLLRLSLDEDERPTGMPVVGMAYPCRTLVEQLDPLALALELDGNPPTERQLRNAATRRATELLAKVVAGFERRSGRVDERWYWAAPVLLDLRCYGQPTAGFPIEPDDEEVHENRTAIDRHAETWQRLVNGELNLGRPPADLAQVVACLALAAPGVTVARSLRRTTPGIKPGDEVYNSAVARVAEQLRLVYNLPTSVGVVQRDGQPYWRQALQYGVAGNLQAVLDEWAHQLLEAEAVLDKPDVERVETVAKAMATALSIRTVTLEADELAMTRAEAALRRTPLRLRTRFAMRFAEGSDREEETSVRLGTLMRAFNSPFHPFVLATTSIGQEGLDFHHYCHAVYHWNLPINPVDLEQREGRVHRYKGHAIRKNLARHYGLAALRECGERSSWFDPWQVLFHLACKDRSPDSCDLVPFWHYRPKGGVCVERRVLAMPLSRETARLPWLKRRLALYRLVFGQPRQDDLLCGIEGDADPELARMWRIDLTPPCS